MTGESPIGPDRADGFPTWSVWVNGSGRWWAIYRAVLTNRQIAEGCRLSARLSH
jgi:hypothetical protein